MDEALPQTPREQLHLPPSRNVQVKDTAPDLPVLDKAPLGATHTGNGEMGDRCVGNGFERGRAWHASQVKRTSLTPSSSPFGANTIVGHNEPSRGSFAHEARAPQHL